MTCPICGKHTLPGAKLCGPCRAALKRARDDSVWELPPGLKRPTGTPASEAPGSTPSRWVLGSRRSLGWRGWAAIVVAAGGLIAAGLKASGTTDSAAVAATRTVRNAASGSVAPSAAPLTSADAPASSMDKAPARGTVSAADAVPRVQDVVQPPRAPEHPPAPSRPVKTPPPVVEAPPPVPVPAPVAPAEPVRIVAAPAPAAPVRPADPWQPLKDALAGCAAQGVFERIGCEHRARTRWCDGHWGEVAQCPGGVANDHGQ